MDGILINLLFGVAFGVITALVGRSKGRSPIGWFFVGFLTGCIGLIIVLVMSNLKAEEAKWKMSEERQRRLKEQLKQERLKTQSFQEHVQNRLDVHDDALDMNTRQIEGGDAHIPLIENKSDEMENCSWFYVKNDKRIGPISFNELKALFRDTTINKNTLIWKEGFDGWKMITDMPELMERLA